MNMIGRLNKSTSLMFVVYLIAVNTVLLHVYLSPSFQGELIGFGIMILAALLNGLVVGIEITVPEKETNTLNYREQRDTEVVEPKSKQSNESLEKNLKLMYRAMGALPSKYQNELSKIKTKG